MTSRPMFDRELGYLEQLRDELVNRFGAELGETLFGEVAVEFLTGPVGVEMAAKYARFQSKV